MDFIVFNDFCFVSLNKKGIFYPYKIETARQSSHCELAFKSHAICCLTM